MSRSPIAGRVEGLRPTTVNRVLADAYVHAGTGKEDR